MIRKTISFMLAFSFVISICGCSIFGCKSSETASVTDETDKGRYIEEEISISDRPSVGGELYSKSDKTFFIDIDDMKLYTQDKGADTFTASDIQLTDELGEDAAPVYAAGLPDGSYIFSYFSSDDDKDKDKEDDEDGSMDDYTPSYAYLTADGKLKKLDLDLKNSIIDAFHCSEDGRIFAVGYDGNVFEINVDSQNAVKLFSAEGNAAGFDVVSDYIICADSKGISIYDYKKNQLRETSDVLNNFWKEQKLNTRGVQAKEPICDFCKGTDDSIYIITQNGLYRYILGGNQVEQILDATAYHLGSPSYHVRSVIAGSENSFLVTYTDGTVMRYRYDPNASNKVDSSIRIYSLTENDTLSQIISEYKISNPNVSVEYTTGMEKNSGVTYEDAVKNLNTQICSDEAPDILMLDGMNINKYIDKNMLIDLKEYENKIDPDDSLIGNIAKQYQDGGLYTMPCKFKIPMITGKKENLAKISSFSSFADMIVNQHNIVKNSPVAFFYTEDEVIDAGLDFLASDIIKDDTLDKNAFKTMLEDCSKIYKAEKSVMQENLITSHNSFKIANSSAADRWTYGLSGNSMSILNNDQRIVCGPADGFKNCLNIITSLNSVNSEIGYRYGISDDSRSYIPNCILGICSTGKNTDNAVQFLKSAFSKNVQNIELCDGFPVNKDSLKYFFDKAKTERGMGFGASNDFDAKQAMVMAKWMDENEASEFTDKTAELDTPEYIDTMTRNTIINTGTKCLDGTITPDEAVDEINEKLSLKMQE